MMADAHNILSSDTTANLPSRTSPITRKKSVSATPTPATKRSATSLGMGCGESSGAEDRIFTVNGKEEQKIWSTPVSSQKKKEKSSETKKSTEKKGKTGKKLRADCIVTVERRTTRRKAAMVNEEDTTAYNNNYCESCRGGGRFVCCDACPRSFHFACVEPPLEIDQIPAENWYCNVCRADLFPPPIPPEGLFQPLLKSMNLRSPMQFSLTRDILDSFSGISSGSLGEYVDTTELKKEKISKAGLAMDRNYDRLKTDKGEIILCYLCGQSALQGKIISCDYCTLHWHWDCVSPPMVSPPSATKKWMCPNHVEHVLPKRRKVKSCIYENPANPYIRNNGDIEIINDEEVPPNETFFTINDVYYRLPEHSIKLQFVDKIKRLKRCRDEIQPEIPTNGVDSLAEVDVWLSSLSKFQQELSSYLLSRRQAERYSTQNNLNVLLQAAMQCEYDTPNSNSDIGNANSHISTDPLHPPLTSAPDSGASSRSFTQSPFNHITDDPDYDAFLAFKRFLKLNGEDKMRKLLNIPTTVPALTRSE